MKASPTLNERAKVTDRVLSDRALAVPGSAIHLITQMIEELERKGAKDIIRLHLGDPDFATPPKVIEATNQALASGKTHYTLARGLRPLREAVGKRLQEKYGLAGDADLITMAAGSAQGLGVAFHAVAGYGDQILFPEIFWPNFFQQAALYGIKVGFYPLTTDYEPDLDRLEACLTPETKAILINSPSNPTGAVFPEKTLRKMYDFACRHNLWVVSDDAYDDIKFTGESFVIAQLERDLPEGQRRVFSIFSFSKSFAMTGFRMGYVHAPSLQAARILGNLQVPMTGALNTPAQYAALAALSEPALTKEMCAAYQRRRDLALNVLKKHGMYDYTPQGAFYLLVDISRTGLDGDAFAQKLLQEKKVAVAQGSGFGFMPQYDARGRIVRSVDEHGLARYPVNSKVAGKVRVSFCVAEEQVEEGMEKLCGFCQRISNG